MDGRAGLFVLDRKPVQLPLDGFGDTLDRVRRVPPGRVKRRHARFPAVWSGDGTTVRTESGHVRWKLGLAIYATIRVGLFHPEDSNFHFRLVLWSAVTLTSNNVDSLVLPLLLVWPVGQ